MNLPTTILRTPNFAAIRICLLVLAGGIIGCFSSSSVDGCDRVGFFLANQLPIGGPTLNVVVADFNDDSKPDFAATNSSRVVVYLGDGAGGFEPPKNYRAGALPGVLAVGDFDHDGKIDLAVANYSDISVLLNDGQGGFLAPVQYEADQSPLAIGVGDFNGDGHLDLAVVNSQSDDVSVLLGDGSGHFGLPTNFPTGDLPYALAVGDLNGDGVLDLVISTYNSEEVNILVGDGQGNFRPTVSYPLGGNGSNVVIGDFNDDRKPDVAVGVFNIFPENHIQIFLGDGGGNFTAGGSVPVFDPQGIVATDFDGDGDLDLAATLYNAPGIVVALGDGIGGFGSPQQVRLPHHPLPFGLATGDFDRDGNSDLAIANYGNGHVTILLNLATVQIEASDPTASGSCRDPGRFRVKRVGCLDAPLRIFYSVSGTAKPGTDYRALSGEVTIPAGWQFADIPVLPLRDTLQEDGATVVVDIVAGDYGIGGHATATVTINK
jgi:hypothetical protein